MMTKLSELGLEVDLHQTIIHKLKCQGLSLAQVPFQDPGSDPSNGCMCVCHLVL